MLDPEEYRLPVDAAAIDALAQRSGDTYLWHMEPGAAYRESELLRARADEAGLDASARLAHGALGLMFALRAAYVQRPDLPIAAVSDLRFVAPIFEGARIGVRVEPMAYGSSAFVVTTDQLQPDLAITGHILYGAVSDDYDLSDFSSLAEQQLFSLEEAIGLISATIGLSVQESGGRVLYMGQALQLEGLASLGSELVATGEVVERRAGRRLGERVTARVAVGGARGIPGKPLASGESIFLWMEV